MKVYIPPTYNDAYNERELIARLERLSEWQLTKVYWFMHWLLLKQKVSEFLGV